MARPFKDARYPGVPSRIKNGKIVYRYRAKGMLICGPNATTAT